MKEYKFYLDAIVKTMTGAESTGVMPPLFTLASSILGVRDSYFDYKMRRNVKAFIEELKEGELEWEDIYSKVPLDKYEDFSNCLNLVLIEGEVKEKSVYLARLLHALMRGIITFEEFNNFVLIIYNLSLPAIKSLERVYKTKPVSWHKDFGEGYSCYAIERSYESLAESTGFASRVARPNSTTNNIDININMLDTVRLTLEGEKFAKFCLKIGAYE